MNKDNIDLLVGLATISRHIANIANENHIESAKAHAIRSKRTKIDNLFTDLVINTSFENNETNSSNLLKEKATKKTKKVGVKVKRISRVE